MWTCVMSSSASRWSGLARVRGGGKLSGGGAAGWVGRERVQRWMREGNRLCLRRRKLVVTTDSDHNRRVDPNVACDLVLGDIHQLWVADIS